MTKKISTLLVTAFAVILAAGCGSDNDPSPEPAKGDIAISFKILNPDGLSGAAHVKLIEGISPRHVNNQDAYPGAFMSGIYGHGESLYVFPAYGGQDKHELTRYDRKNGVLTPSGKLVLPPQSAAASMAILNSHKGYISLQGLGKLIVFDPSSMTKTGEIDLNGCIADLKDDNGTAVSNPSPGVMIIRDGTLFVALSAMVGEYWLPSEKRPYSDMALIDTRTDKLLKVITEKTSGLAFPGRPIDRKTIFEDESGDIYVACLGGFGYKNIDAGFLRLKKGATDFDPSYSWVISKQAISGGDNNSMPKYIPSCQYIGDGKVCAYVFVKDGQQSHGHVDLACVPVLLDLRKKTMVRINIPVTSGYAAAIARYKGKVIFGNMNVRDKGLYIYDPQTNTASDKAVVTTDGLPWQMYSFSE